MYQELSVGLSAQVYWVKAGIDAVFQKLNQTGAIKITVQDFVPDAQHDQQETWALDFFKDRLLATWFEPWSRNADPDGRPAGRVRRWSRLRR